MRSQLARVGCTAGLGQRVSSLSVAQRHLLEVAKSLAADPAVLILDEPTAALGADETAALFAELRRLAASGVAVVYITHRLAEVRELCQQVTVLRDGAVRGSFRVADVSDAQLLELIVGPGGDGRVPGQGGPGGRPSSPVLAVDELLRPRLPRRVADRRRPGRSSAWPASWATGRASSCARWPGWATRPAGPSCAARRSSRAGRTPRWTRAWCTCPPTGSARACSARCRSGRTRWYPRSGQFSRGGVVNRRAEARAVEAQRDEPVHQGAVHRGQRAQPVRRQPAEGAAGPGAAEPAGRAAAGRGADPGRGRRRPGRDLPHPAPGGRCGRRGGHRVLRHPGAGRPVRPGRGLLRRPRRRRTARRQVTRGRHRARHADLDPAAAPGRAPRPRPRGRLGRAGPVLAAPGRPRRLRRPRRAGHRDHRAGRCTPRRTTPGSCPRST